MKERQVLISKNGEYQLVFQYQTYTFDPKNRRFGFKVRRGNQEEVTRYIDMLELLDQMETYYKANPKSEDRDIESQKHDILWREQEVPDYEKKSNYAAQNYRTLLEMEKTIGLDSQSLARIRHQKYDVMPGGKNHMDRHDVQRALVHERKELLNGLNKMQAALKEKKAQSILSSEEFKAMKKSLDGLAKFLKEDLKTREGEKARDITSEDEFKLGKLLTELEKTRQAYKARTDRIRNDGKTLSGSQQARAEVADQLDEIIKGYKTGTTNTEMNKKYRDGLFVLADKIGIGKSVPVTDIVRGTAMIKYGMNFMGDKRNILDLDKGEAFKFYQVYQNNFNEMKEQYRADTRRNTKGLLSKIFLTRDMNMAVTDLKEDLSKLEGVSKKGMEAFAAQLDEYNKNYRANAITYNKFRKFIKN